MPRFRLRTFLIAITAFCLLLGWRVAAVESVERPIRELERLGWELNYPKVGLIYIAGIGYCEGHRPRGSYWMRMLRGHSAVDLPEFASLQYTDQNPPGPDFPKRMEMAIRYFNRLPSIHTISLDCPSLDAQVVAKLARSIHVRSLRIRSDTIDREAVPQLASLTYLKSLTVRDARLSVDQANLLREHIPDCHLNVDIQEILKGLQQEQLKNRSSPNGHD
ncbi:hypothetical protein [Aeoliella sp. SH292]|uniref:hypothetical protein n=1 Tax=Aeoliella sp. SH292 TaxID=3454464 RepID=UPI003F95E721